MIIYFSFIEKILARVYYLLYLQIDFGLKKVAKSAVYNASLAYSIVCFTACCERLDVT